jgi:hypothetical protein
MRYVYQKLRKKRWNSPAWMGRQLLACVVLPALLLIGADMVAQKSKDAAVLSGTQQQQSDNRIADEINQKLMDSNMLRPLDLGVWVHDGTATLSGTVPNIALRSQADALVHSVPGVKAVNDQMNVGTVAAIAPRFANSSPASANAGNVRAAAGVGYAPAANRAPARAYQRPALPLLTIPAQTPLYVRMLQTVDSHHTRPGTGFRGILIRDIMMRNGIIALPRGAYVEGTVIDARPPGHLKGSPKLALQLSNVNVGRTSYVLSSYTWAHQGPGKGGQTASAVAGGAGFGAITGAIVGGGPVALLGAAIGGLGSAGLSALSPGAHLVVPAELIVTFHLNAPLTVQEPTMNDIHMLAANLPGYSYRRRRYAANPQPVSGPPPIPGAPPGGYPY